MLQIVLEVKAMDQLGILQIEDYCQDCPFEKFNVPGHVRTSSAQTAGSLEPCAECSIRHPAASRRNATVTEAPGWNTESKSGLVEGLLLLLRLQ